MTRFLLTAALTALLALPAVAHDPWVQANTAVVRTGDAVHFDLMLGNHGNDHRDFKLASKLTAELIKTFDVIGPDGKAYDLKADLIDQGYAPKEGYYTAKFVPAKPGVYVAAQTLDTVMKKGDPIRAYRSAKTVVVASDSLDKLPKDLKGFDKPLGHRFELVPTVNPVAAAGPGKAIAVQLLFDGKPLEGVKVSFIPRGATLKEGTDADHERTTDKDGKASFTPKTGNYVLVVAHLPREEKGDGYEKAHYAATLTVLVPEKCPCCGD